METVHIHHLRARYHLPGIAAGARRRLDRVVASELANAVDSALARDPLAPGEEVCIRRLSVPVRINLAVSDSVLAEGWGAAIATAIRTAKRLGTASAGALSNGESIEVACFTSRAHALLDCALQVIAGDARRVWAWRQLGLWERGEDPPRGPEGVRALVRALLREPGLIVPVLTRLAELGRLEKLASELQAPHWISLAAAALDFSGASVHSGELSFISSREPGLSEALAVSPPASGLAPAPGGKVDDTRPDLPVAQWVERHNIRAIAEQVVRDSQIGGQCPVGHAAAGEASLAALMVLEAKPEWTARSKAAWLELLQAVWRVRQSVSAAPGTAATPPLRAATAPPPVQGQIEPGADGAGAADSKAVSKEQAATECLAPDPRRRGFTRFGGLLFLLNLLPVVGVPACIEMEFPSRSLRSMLYSLGLRLAQAASSGAVSVGQVAPRVLADDPAILGFAGLPPGVAPPEQLAEAERDTERMAVLAGKVVAELERRLPEPPLGAPCVLTMVCRRDAEILADPGWFQVRLALREVSTDLRRVALDLDPGFIPWLGIVVRFIYE